MKVFLPEKRKNDSCYLLSEPHVVLIDNYDSFTYNVVQSLINIGCKVSVFLNDEIEVEDLADCGALAFMISPGPMDPSMSGVSMDVLRRYTGVVPILGICLGFQCIVEYKGGRIGVLDEIVHGKISMIYHIEHPLFEGLENPFPAARYHSLGTLELPMGLDKLAWSKKGIIMAAGNNKEKIAGIQFHPESFMTPGGGRIFFNFLRIYANA